MNPTEQMLQPRRHVYVFLRVRAFFFLRDMGIHTI